MALFRLILAPVFSFLPEIWEMATLLITDSSVLLNVIASGHAPSIFRMSSWQFVVCPKVAEEVKFLRHRISREVRPVELAPYFAASDLQCMAPETDEDFEWLVDFTAALGRGGEGEAMCFALAASRKLAVAIDDRKAIRKARRFSLGLPIISTPELIKEWSTTAGIEKAPLCEALRSISDWACYKPSDEDPLAAWWTEVLQG